MIDDGHNINEPGTDCPGDFETVVEKYEAPLLRYVSRLVSDADAAQDIVQNTFIKLSLHWKIKAGRPSAELSAWLYRVAHNNAVDYVRKEARRRVFLVSHAENSDHRVEAHGSERSDKAEQATALLQTLTMRERLIVTLKVYEEKSYHDRAQIIGISEGNVGYILHHAMQKLATAVEKRGLDENTSSQEA